MQFNASLDEIVLFELPTRNAAEELMSQVSATRLAWLQTENDAFVLGVVLLPDVDDLAALMRGVQGWVERSGLGAIRFEVDGRTYALEARLPILAG